MLDRIGKKGGFLIVMTYCTGELLHTFFLFFFFLHTIQRNSGIHNWSHPGKGISWIRGPLEQLQNKEEQMDTGSIWHPWSLMICIYSKSMIKVAQRSLNFHTTIDAHDHAGSVDMNLVSNACISENYTIPSSSQQFILWFCSIDFITS